MGFSSNQLRLPNLLDFFNEVYLNWSFRSFTIRYNLFTFSKASDKVSLKYTLTVFFINSEVFFLSLEKISLNDDDNDDDDKKYIEVTIYLSSPHCAQVHFFFLRRKTSITRVLSLISCFTSAMNFSNIPQY